MQSSKEEQEEIKKAFLSEQCKEIKENHRIYKTQDIFQRIGDIKGTFHTRMGMIKEINDKDLIGEKQIQKRWQEYTGKLYQKKVLMIQITTMVPHLEPDILESEVKWALGSFKMNKASGGDRIAAELFQILKDDAVKVLHSILKYLESSTEATGLEKVSFHSNPKEMQCQRMVKLPYNCTHFTC